MEASTDYNILGTDKLLLKEGILEQVQDSTVVNMVAPDIIITHYLSTNIMQIENDLMFLHYLNPKKVA